MDCYTYTSPNSFVMPRWYKMLQKASKLEPSLSLPYPSTPTMAKVWTISASPSMGMAFFIGVFLHVFLFNKGEWDLHTMKIVHLFFALFLSLAIGLGVFSHFLHSRLSWNPFVFSLGLVGSMVLGLFASITAYRASFHRLNRFPGPFAARLSNLYITRLSAKNLQLYREVQRLHQTYGDVVRVGKYMFLMMMSLEKLIELVLTCQRPLGALHNRSRGRLRDTLEQFRLFQGPMVQYRATRHLCPYDAKQG